jgi:predicted kinase
MPSLYMLIGVPGSGKSTWTANQDLIENVAVVSSDDIVEDIGRLFGLDYSETFKLFGDGAVKLSLREAASYFHRDENVIWDQTNASKKSRAKKLDMVPDHYKKFAVYFQTPDEAELKRRLGSRPGKHIPPYVMEGMLKSLETPELEEGFDSIIVVCPNL